MINEQKVLDIISHLKYNTPYNTMDLHGDIIQCLSELLEQTKPSKAFKRYYLYHGDNFLQTALNLEAAKRMSESYLKMFPEMNVIDISTLDGDVDSVRRDEK